MSSLNTSLFVLACTFGGALLGMFLRRVLPEHHIAAESKDVVRISMGLVATTVALILGLLVYSAKSFYDTQTNEVTQLAANVLLLDRVLARYGPDAAGVRAELQHSIQHQMNLLWPDSDSKANNSPLAAPTGEALVDRIHDLSPQSDKQKSLQAQALSLALQMGQTRLLMYTQRNVPVPKALLVMLVFWLVALFISFGLFAPPNFTVILSLFISATAICGALFLMVEMYFPYGGLIQVSSVPLRAALAQMGQ